MEYLIGDRDTIRGGFQSCQAVSGALLRAMAQFTDATLLWTLTTPYLPSPDIFAPNRRNDRPINQPTDRSSDRPTNQSSDRPPTNQSRDDAQEHIKVMTMLSDTANGPERSQLFYLGLGASLREGMASYLYMVPLGGAYSAEDVPLPAVLGKLCGRYC